jgi:uncharacterized membrane protein
MGAMAVDKDLSPARVEAFSDGVIAIIITIMVLELHVPQDHTLKGLLELWPTLSSYALSYLMVAIYWVNHHHLFSVVKRVDIGILWSNIVLLFVLSLVPFATAFVGQSHMSSFSVLVYAALLFASGLAFMGLKSAIAKHHFRGDPQLEELDRAATRKNAIALAMYALAGLSAYWHVTLSLALITLVAVMYLVPNSWIESAAD